MMTLTGRRPFATLLAVGALLTAACSSGSKDDDGGSSIGGTGAGTAVTSELPNAENSVLFYTFAEDAEGWKSITPINVASPQVTHIPDDGSLAPDGCVEISFASAVQQPAVQNNTFLGVRPSPAIDATAATTISMDVKVVSGTNGAYQIGMNVGIPVKGAFTPLSSVPANEWKTITLGIGSSSERTALNQLVLEFVQPVTTVEETITLRLDNVRVH